MDTKPNERPSRFQIDRSPDNSVLAALKIYDDRESKDCASWYFAGIRVLGDNQNPDRYALAAHSFREILEKIFSYHSHQPKSEFNTLKKKFQDVCEGKIANAEKFLNDKEYTRFHKFLKYCIKAFKRYDKNEPKQQDHVKKTIGIDDNAEIPDKAQEAIVKHYQGLRGYFTLVSHHNGGVDIYEFEEKYRSFEVFILRTLEPGTILDDSYHILRIIKEGEDGG